MDFNADGKKDLIVGDADGLVFVFLNVGTDAEPKLAAGTRLVVAGKPFKWDGTRTKPAVVDWNNDGLFDLVIGEERGRVLLLLNSGKKAEPKFDAAVPLKDGDKDLKVWMRGDPCVTDWDGDGKKDLLVADEGGKVVFFRNRGTDEAPVFAGSVNLRAKGWPIRPGTSSYFRMDLDGDGKPEVISANNRGEVVVYAGREKRNLTFGGKAFASEHGRPTVLSADWNADGRPDLMVAERSGRIHVAIDGGKGKAVEFGALTVLEVDGKPLDGGPGATAQVEDADGDDKPDLICWDETGTVRVFRNSGTVAAPILKKIDTPEKASSEICGGYRARLDVADWNGDGRKDLIYGVTSFLDSRCRVYVFLRSK